MFIYVFFNKVVSFFLRYDEIAAFYSWSSEECLRPGTPHRNPVCSHPSGRDSHPAYQIGGVPAEDRPFQSFR